MNDKIYNSKEILKIGSIEGSDDEDRRKDDLQKELLLGSDDSHKGGFDKSRKRR